MFNIDERKRQLVGELLAVIAKFPKIIAKRKDTDQKRSEIMLLFCLGRSGQPEMKISEISRRLNVKAPTVTQLVNELENKGQVERVTRTTDRRAVWVKLTEEGQKVIKKAEQALEEKYSGLIEYLGEEESKQLVSLLNKVYGYFIETIDKGEESSTSEGGRQKC